MIMNGQPQGVAPWMDLDVTTLEVLRESEPVVPAGFNVLPIVDEREEFELGGKFSIKGFPWTWMLIAAGGEAGISVQIEISAYGAGDHINLPPQDMLLSDLDQAGDTYSYKVIVPRNTFTKNGVYNFESVLTFENSTTHVPFHGLLGFSEGLRVLIHEREDDLPEGTLP
jgi:hypothetical protein